MSLDVAPALDRLEAEFNLVRLRILVDRLERQYDAARSHLADEVSHSPMKQGKPPEEATDRNGRYILVDALSAIVSARAVLARLENR